MGDIYQYAISIAKTYQYAISRRANRKCRLRNASISGYVRTSGGHMAYANLLRPEFPRAR